MLKIGFVICAGKKRRQMSPTDMAHEAIETGIESGLLKKFINSVIGML